MRTCRWASLTLVLAGALACRSASGPPAVHFDRAPVPSDVPVFVNWEHPPITGLDEIQQQDRARLRGLRAVEGASSVRGSNTVRFRLEEADGSLSCQGRPAPMPQLDDYDRSPRKEMAAYWVQTLFLEREDFVVPFSGMRCVPHRLWQQAMPAHPSSVPGTSCVLVNFSYRLRDVAIPERLYEQDRFLQDPNYAYRIASFNLHQYLIQGRDTRKGNVLVSLHTHDRRVFSVVNDVSFGEWAYNWLALWTFAWQDILVPALPRNAIESLRKLERGDLDGLGTLVQLAPDARHVLRVVASEPPFNAEEGVRVRGRVVQFGLTQREIDAVWQRIEELVRRVDAGEAHRARRTSPLMPPATPAQPARS